MQGALWGARPQAWAEVQELTAKPLWERMLDAADVRPGMELVDLGCGAGHALALAHGRGARVSGLDASAALLEYARVRVPLAELHAGDLEELPFDSARFDVVMATNSLQYSADRGRAMREMARVKRPNGCVVVGMWAEPEKNEMTAVFAAMRALAPPPPGAAPPADLSQRANLIAAVRDAGLAVARDDEVECVFAYRDEAQYLAAQRSAGPLEAAARAAGEAAVEDALRDVARPFTAPDGSIRFRNRMRFVLAR